jgi:hypothetical protein
MLERGDGKLHYEVANLEFADLALPVLSMYKIGWLYQYFLSFNTFDFSANGYKFML